MFPPNTFTSARPLADAPFTAFRGIPAIPLQADGAVVLLFGLVFFLGYLAAIYWTYQDARTNSDQPAFLWALVVFFAPLLGLLLYVLLGRN